MSIKASDFNHHGFGVEAIEAIAAALNHDIGGCGNCNPDRTGEPCEDDHFYPFAESALRGLASTDRTKWSSTG
jgi:predicted HD phosphohydrolase